MVQTILNPRPRAEPRSSPSHSAPLLASWPCALASPLGPDPTASLLHGPAAIFPTPAPPSPSYPLGPHSSPQPPPSPPPPHSRFPRAHSIRRVGAWSSKACRSSYLRGEGRRGGWGGPGDPEREPGPGLGLPHRRRDCSSHSSSSPSSSSSSSSLAPIASMATPARRISDTTRRRAAVTFPSVRRVEAEGVENGRQAVAAG